MRTPVLRVVLVLCGIWGSWSWGRSPQPEDRLGVLKKPIPDKLVVLTFDDGPASHATVVAPVLKQHGFGGSFYVCDFDSFRTRKDWYLTWRQMKAMAADGLEIGNHTMGHAGGAAIGSFLAMDDDLIANGVPRSTTVCWPVYHVNTSTFPDLSANGYIFGRGGHDRAYLPTVDHPFDVPSFSISDEVSVETFMNYCAQAKNGRVAVITFHGVPDGEHPSVGLDPATFRKMMQFLKDNQYRCIALRDMAEFIDPVKAAALPPTSNQSTELTAGALVVARPATRKPAQVATAPLSSAKEILSFEVPGGSIAAISSQTMGLYVPMGTELNALVPSFKVSPGATAEPASGVVRDFSKGEVAYSITAQDGSKQEYKVRAIASAQPVVFTWNSPMAGAFSDVARWSNNLAAQSTPLASGQDRLQLNFPGPRSGPFTVSNDMAGEFRLNQLTIGNPGLTLAGALLVPVANPEAGLLPKIRLSEPGDEAKINTAMKLGADLELSVENRASLALEGEIFGEHRLVKTGPGRLKISHVGNSYSGGTLVTEGELYLFVANLGLGTGPVHLSEGATLNLEHVDGTNPLFLSGGTIDGNNGFGNHWDAEIHLERINKISSYAGFHLNQKQGGISGPGGLTQIGPQGGFGRVNGGWVYLWGVNTYTGPTTVLQGTLGIMKAVSLYNGNVAQWTPQQISVAPAATLVISAGGPAEFTAAQVGTLLENLTRGVDNNGLRAGSVFCVDTTNATKLLSVSGKIQDSKGPGGGPFTLTKDGAGTLELAGHNTYSGQTVLQGGTLRVSSFNRVVGGRPSSSLGTPGNDELAEVVIGRRDQDADLALVYTGPGEATDRVLNMSGKNVTFTLDHAGSGLLKIERGISMSGHSAGKTLILQGGESGQGELAGDLADPFDRAGLTRTTVVKKGRGTWVLSARNTASGPTQVLEGNLVLKTAQSLSPETELSLVDGAGLDLAFAGEMRVKRLTIAGQPQAAGVYRANKFPGVLRGTGQLRVAP